VARLSAADGFCRYPVGPEDLRQEGPQTRTIERRSRSRTVPERLLFGSALVPADVLSRRPCPDPPVPGG
jgi:hypothetical protein